MKMVERNLGKLESVHGIAPAFLQRAAIVAVLSFVFFLSTLAAFFYLQNIMYFLLATAFLIVQLFTLFGWVAQKRAVLKFFENGFTYRKHVCFWDEIESMRIESVSRLAANEKISGEIKKKSGEKIVLTETIDGVQNIMERIDEKIAERE